MNKLTTWIKSHKLLTAVILLWHYSLAAWAGWMDGIPLLPMALFSTSLIITASKLNHDLKGINA